MGMSDRDRIGRRDPDLLVGSYDSTLVNKQLNSKILKDLIFWFQKIATHFFIVSLKIFFPKECIIVWKFHLIFKNKFVRIFCSKKGRTY